MTHLAAFTIYKNFIIIIFIFIIIIFIIIIVTFSSFPFALQDSMLVPLHVQQWKADIDTVDLAVKASKLSGAMP